MFRRIPKPVFVALISENTPKAEERKEYRSTEWSIAKEQGIT